MRTYLPTAIAFGQRTRMGQQIEVWVHMTFPRPAVPGIKPVKTRPHGPRRTREYPIALAGFVTCGEIRLTV